MGVAIPQVITPDSASGAQVINGSMLFTGDNYLTRTPGSATNRKTWTFSAWIKRWAALDISSNFSTIFGANSDGMELYFHDDGTLSFYDYSGGGYQARLVTTERFRDPTGWYHIVAVSDTTDALDSFRWRLYVNGKRITKFSTETYPSVNYDTGVNSTGLHVLGRYGTGADTVRKAKLYQTNNYLIDGLALGPGYFGYTDPISGQWKPKKFRAQGTTVNDGKTFSSTGTFSNWDDDGTYPKTELFDGTIYSGGTPNGASSDSGSAATFDFGEQRITGFSNLKINIFLSSSQASTPNLVSVNGRDITNECHAAGNNTWTTVDLQDKFTTLQSFSIANNNIYVGGFIVDGVIMKDTTTESLAFGDNGFYMPFEDQSDFEKDKSGNGNDFTKNGFTGTETNPDIVKDSPAGPAFGGAPISGVTTTSAIPSNYCTLNNVYHGSTMSNGNLSYVSGSANVATVQAVGTVGVSKGKYYFEVTCTASSGSYSNTWFIGYVKSHFDSGKTIYTQSDSVLYYGENGNKWVNNSGSSYGASYTNNDVIGVAADISGNSIAFYKNNAKQGDISFTFDGTYLPTISNGDNSSSVSATLNFGQKPFKYAPPEGYLPLSYSSVRSSLTDLIPNAKQYVGVATYIGNQTARDIKMEGLAPDLVWVKSRPSSYHIWTDSVRGVNKQIYSNTNDTEASNTDRLASFNKDGFSLDANDSSGGVNTDNYAYVAWAWRAGGSKNTFNVDDVGYANASDVNMNAGGLNSTVYNQSQTWSSFGGSGTYSSSYDWTKMFNGDPNGDSGTIPADGSSITADFTSLSGGGIVYTSSFKLYYRRNTSAPDVKVNGSGIGAPANGYNGVYSLTGTGLITSVGTDTRTAAGAGDCALQKIEIDGQELVDSGVTPSNVPSVANTGASVGTKQGFSIVTYSGNSDSTKTISHGLTKKPDFILTKRRTTSASSWICYHSTLGAGTHIKLDQNSAKSTAANIYPIEPNSHVFVVGSDADVGSNGNTYVSYVWHNVPGLQKFDRFIGGGSEYPYIELGFSPAVVMIKNADTGGTYYDWQIIDNKRDPHNIGDDDANSRNTLFANTDAAENYASTPWLQIDFLATGFRVNDTSVSINKDGDTLIYAAWAEAPAFGFFGGGANAF